MSWEQQKAWHDTIQVAHNEDTQEFQKMTDIFKELHISSTIVVAVSLFFLLFTLCVLEWLGYLKINRK